MEGYRKAKPDHILFNYSLFIPSIMCFYAFFSPFRAYSVYNEPKHVCMWSGRVWMQIMLLEKPMTVNAGQLLLMYIIY